jgi:microcystin-dependent protein
MSVSSALGQNFPMPVGSVMNYLGKNIPPSFLLCDGTEYNINDYPLLFQAVSSAYGGDGETTFAVPNLINEFISGIEQNTNPPTFSVGGGTFSGNYSFTIAETNMPSISLDATASGTDLTPVSITGQIGYTNGVLKQGSQASNSPSGSTTTITTIANDSSNSALWNFQVLSASGTYTAPSGRPYAVSGSVSNLSGTPSYYSLKYIIKATP